jgi:hypothetical protein
MEAKDKARELVDKFRQYSNAYKWTANVASREIVIVDVYEQLKNAKQCALIAVDEIVKERTPPFIMSDDRWNYWQEVKKYISYE